MALVFVFAIGLAALRTADSLWAGMLLLAALAAFGVALIGAVVLRGSERAWWAGFAFFEGAYLALVFGPWLSDTLQPQLGTTQLLSLIHGRMHPSMVQMEDNLADLQIEREEARAAWLRDQRTDGKYHPATLNRKAELAALDQKIADIRTAPTQDQFQRTGHSLFALLAGLAGGTVATWFYVRQKRTDAAAAPF